MLNAVIYKDTKRAFLENYEGVRLLEFIPHPDGDPEMTREGVEIILSKIGLGIKEWKLIADGYEGEISKVKDSDKETEQ